MSKKNKFTSRQLKFIECYNSNATTAASEAGYSKKTAYSSGQRLLKNVGICKAINEREAEKIRPLIATREDRQKFWSEVMNDKTQAMADRLRAAELLARSNADFTDNLNFRDKTDRTKIEAEEISTIRNRIFDVSHCETSN